MKSDEVLKVLETVDALVVALTEHGHTWTQEERSQYEQTTTLLRDDHERAAYKEERSSSKEQQPTFESELRDLINRHSLERFSDTPDFILAEMLAGFLTRFNDAMIKRTTHKQGAGISI